jgi:hypothetical protein
LRWCQSWVSHIAPLGQDAVIQTLECAAWWHRTGVFADTHCPSTRGPTAPGSISLRPGHHSRGKTLNAPIHRSHGADQPCASPAVRNTEPSLAGDDRSAFGTATHHEKVFVPTAQQDLFLWSRKSPIRSVRGKRGLPATPASRRSSGRRSNDYSPYPCRTDCCLFRRRQTLFRQMPVCPVPGISPEFVRRRLKPWSTPSSRTRQECTRTRPSSGT